jgi:hypothetical protein
MGFDDVLMAIVVVGIGLSVVYLIAETLRWRERGAAQRRREAVQHDLHAARLSQQEAARPSVSFVQDQEFTAVAAERSSARHVSQRVYPLVERRKRPASRDAASSGSIGGNA